MCTSEVVGNEVSEMGSRSPDDRCGDGGEQLTLRVDDRGRITIPKRVRERIGIEDEEQVSARVSGSVLRIDPRPSARLETATAGRDDWTNTTPTDAGESLFGPLETDEE